MVRIGVRMPASFQSAGEFLADVQALESAGADLLSLGAGDLHHATVLAAMAATTTTVKLHSFADLGPAAATLERLGRGRILLEIEGWAEVPFPSSRDEWRQTLADHDERGVAGVIVDMDDRLLDLLRNPDLEDDRSQDLQLAQG